ncbi:hypothetical protein C8F01DRAFT_1234511 [Mycena amicta]|nr:hypothetical protein C8F01DRAFT_1234511 [Mycena amicta]
MNHESGREGDERRERSIASRSWPMRAASTLQSDISKADAYLVFGDGPFKNLGVDGRTWDVADCAGLDRGDSGTSAGWRGEHQCLHEWEWPCWLRSSTWAKVVTWHGSVSWCQERGPGGLSSWMVLIFVRWLVGTWAKSADGEEKGVGEAEGGGAAAGFSALALEKPGGRMGAVGVGGEKDDMGGKEEMRWQCHRPVQYQFDWVSSSKLFHAFNRCTALALATGDVRNCHVTPSAFTRNYAILPVIEGKTPREVFPDVERSILTPFEQQATLL